MKPLLAAFLMLICSAWLSACSRLDAPAAGSYRAYLKLRGGEAPFMLEIKHAAGMQANIQLYVVQDNTLLPATQLNLHQGTLQAELPAGLGSLQASWSSDEMKGELRITDQQGKPQVLPFAAELNKHYRFVEDSSSDNADVSGYWELEAISPEHFSMPVTLHLQQKFDAVDGRLQLTDGKVLPVFGQVHGEALYLSVVSAGRVVLLQGKVTPQGELAGELWTNMSNAKHWAAKRLSEAQSAVLKAEQDSLRPVLLHWAVPVPSKVATKVD